MQLFGYSDIPEFVRISRLNWIDQVKRMDIKRVISQEFNNNPKGSRLRELPKKKYGGIVYKRILIDSKLKT
jgi:hypothetical protein